MGDVWEAGQDVKDMVQEIAAEHHPDLAVILDKIAILFKEKSTKSGGVVIPGKAKKAPGIIEILGKKPFVFILEIGGDVWGTFSNTQRVALLDHLLCACRMKADENGDGVKYFIAPPDFSFFKEEILRHGVWQSLDQEDDTDEAATQIEDNFGARESSEE